MKLLRNEVENKKVLVFGSGISGIGAVKLLEALKAQVVLYDGNEKLQEEQIRKQLEPGSTCNIVLGELKEELIPTLDLVVMSPGVPLDIPPVERLKAAGIPIWGEVELAYQMGAGKVLAITGTNGKTTTTALLGEIIAFKVRDFPFLRVADVLFNFMLFTGCLTVTLQASFFFPYFAVITAVPFFLAFTTPFEDTVATLLLLLVQVIFPLVPFAFSV